MIRCEVGMTSVCLKDHAVSLRNVTLATTIISLVAVSGPARAECSYFEEAMRLISVATNDICLAVPPSGSSRVSDGSGSFNATLNKYLGPILSLGGSVQGSIKDETYTNVVRQQLAGLMVNAQNCRERVSGALVDRAFDSAKAAEASRFAPRTVKGDSQISHIPGTEDRSDGPDVDLSVVADPGWKLVPDTAHLVLDKPPIRAVASSLWSIRSLDHQYSARFHAVRTPPYGYSGEAIGHLEATEIWAQCVEH